MDDEEPLIPQEWLNRGPPSDWTVADLWYLTMLMQVRIDTLTRMIDGFMAELPIDHPWRADTPPMLDDMRLSNFKAKISIGLGPS